MAEQEVVKHTKKVYKVWTSKHHSFWHKLKEFFIEIFIIVFAITLSIWFHDRSEHAHQQKDVKEFLLGLKDDLKNDIKEMESDVEGYQRSNNAFMCINRLKPKEILSKDSFRLHAPGIFNTVGFIPNNGRFEGFKSSGKVGMIENIHLQNDIMDLYQEDIPVLAASAENYTKSKYRLNEFVQRNRLRTTDSTSNILELFSNGEVYYICQSLTQPTQIFQRYDICIQKMKKIITTIDSTYQQK
jgi:Family of unknown function (DUF6090)